jgi:Outer membrane protein beta-barrel domain
LKFENLPYPFTIIHSITLTMKRKITHLFFVFFFLSSCLLLAQNRFKAGVAVGFNLAQLDGDLQQGYDKFGLSLGLKGFVIIKPQFDVSAELFFNQKGATFTGSTNTVDTKKLYPNFTHNYADVLFLANFNINPNDAETHYRHTFHTGVSFGRLLNSKTSVQRGTLFLNDLEQKLTKDYKSNDVSFVIGWSWFFNKRIGLTIRHTLSLSNMYENPLNAEDRKNGNPSFQSLRSYFLSAQVFYNFISPKKIGVDKTKRKTKKNDLLEEL